MKKPYDSPELALIRIDFSTAICTGLSSSMENVVLGVEEPFGDDDLV